MGVHKCPFWKKTEVDSRPLNIVLLRTKTTVNIAPSKPKMCKQTPVFQGLVTRVQRGDELHRKHNCFWGVTEGDRKALYIVL